MTKYLTSQQVAELYGVDRSRISRLAKARGIKPTVIGTSHLWSEAQARRLKPGTRGRPKASR
jgi:hypothetical protein